MHDRLLMLIYASITCDDRLATLLAALSQWFDCSSGVLLYNDERRPLADFSVAHGPLNNPDVQQRYVTRFAALDPAPIAMQRLEMGKVLSTDLSFDRTRQDYRVFLEEFYYPLGFEGTIGGPVTKSDGRTGIVAVHRSPLRAAFGQDDVARLESLMPHLKQMLDLRRVFFESRRAARAMAAALDGTTTAIMLLNADGTLDHANSVSRSLLARQDGLSLGRNGRLVARDVAADRRLRTALRECPLDPKGTLVIVPRLGADQPYVLRICRSSEAEPAGRDYIPRICIYVAEGKSPATNPSAQLRLALGLTPSSARLVSALVSGETMNNYATRNALSRSTVKFHLRSAFDVTGCRRQSDLVQLATSITRDLGFA